MKRTNERRKRAEYFWDEEFYEANKSKFKFRKPILFTRHVNGGIFAVFKAAPSKSGKYTGAKLREIRAKNGVGRRKR